MRAKQLTIAQVDDCFALTPLRDYIVYRPSPSISKRLGIRVGIVSELDTYPRRTLGNSKRGANGHCGASSAVTTIIMK